MDLAGVLIFSVVASAIIGCVVGSEKGRGIGGFFLGLLLGPFGVVTVAAMGYSGKEQRKFEQRLAAAFGPSTEQREYEEELRAWAVRDAILHDPSLAVGEDPADLRRLAAEADNIILEHETRKLRDAARVTP